MCVHDDMGQKSKQNDTNRKKASMCHCCYQRDADRLLN